MSGPAPVIRALDGDNPADMATARRMFELYQDFLGVDLCFQNFQAELDGLPGDYAAPEGGIWIATDGVEPDGVCACVALRPQKGVPNAAELKRLYVFDRARGHGLGRRLCDVAIEAARTAGYGEIRLDTLPTLTTAIALYRAMGFVDSGPPPGSPAPASADAPDGLVYLSFSLR